MKLKNILLILLSGLIFLFKSGFAQAAVCPSGKSYCWYRGSTHNHIKNMDPIAYRDMYKNSGLTPAYDILVGYNHDYDPIYDCATQETQFSFPPNFLGICGAELSGYGHILAFGINNTQAATNYTSNTQGEVTATINAGGVPIKNHPISDGISVSSFIALNSLYHFEVFNGGRPEQTAASETLWNGVLSANNGRIVYGVAADDDHEGNPFAVGWVMVKANSLTKIEIVSNFRNGNFYASTGVILNDYVIDKASRSITVYVPSGSTTTFIGNGYVNGVSYTGQVLYTTTAATAIFTVPSGSKNYTNVRAKITNSSGVAWTQPVDVSYFDGALPTPTPGGPTSSPGSSPLPTPRPTPRISPSPSATPITRNGDADGNGIVNTSDVTYLLLRWMQNLTTSADQFIDTKINSLDFAVVAKALAS